ncbi:MAG: 50S ribosomal protein L6 [Thermoplasmata archaeon]|nr:50S ribosomal protein L6 [Thermoplasmata archaeon]
MSTDADRTHAVVELPAGVTVVVDGRFLKVKGPLGSAQRPFPADVLGVAVKDGQVTLTLLLAPGRRASQALLGTWAAHTRNLIAGLTRGVEARLKVVAAHFPMKVSVRGDELVIENFLGEKFPRSAHLVPGTVAQVDGEFVILSGTDIEQVGQSGANIERATHIRDYDPRVFQDGIYLTERSHFKEVG